MKHQAAGPDLGVTVFRARYSHPNLDKETRFTP
jgi:hypothetical protein